MTNILTFEKNAEFYYNRHLKAFEKGEFIDALSNIRYAIDKDPDNDEYQFCLAETLTEMDLFEEANCILFKLLEKGQKFNGDVMFDIAANLFNMGDYEKAEETFSHYITEYPEGSRIEDARDAFDLLSNAHQEEEPIKDATMESANNGKLLLDSGRFQEAIEVMEPLAKNNPRAAFLQNNLSLAYFCVGDTEKAIETSERMLRLQPRNIHTICNLAIFHSTFDSESAVRYCRLLDNVKTEDEADFNKMLLTFCEVGIHDRAYEIAKQLIALSPYDKRLLFIYAAACANTGRLSDSVDAYMKMLYIDPRDTIALYYKNNVQRAYEADPNGISPQQYVYQVPLNEIHRRLGYLHEQSSAGERNMRMLWEEDEYFVNTIIWGLYFSDYEIKKVCGDIICAFNDKKADDILRKYIMDSFEPDIVKSDLFITMSRYGYKQPYLAYIGGKLAEVRVGSFDTTLDMTKGNSELLKLIAEADICKNDADFLREIIDIVGQYYYAQERRPKFVNKNAWAAAFVFYTMQLHGMGACTLGYVCDIFSAADTSVKRCLRLIEKSLGDNL